MEDRQERIQELEVAIGDLERQLEETRDDPTLEPEIAKMNSKLRSLNEAKAEADSQRKNARYEMTGVNTR